MTDPERPEDGTRGAGALTGVTGTRYPVDASADRRARGVWVMLIGGPVIWFAHFMIVYLVAEAACTGDGPGMALFNPPVLKIVIAAATVAAALGCLLLIGRGYQSAAESRNAPGDRGGGDGNHATIYSGLLLSGLSLIATLFVAFPSLVLAPC
jgi:hypothetical protein